MLRTREDKQMMAKQTEAEQATAARECIAIPRCNRHGVLPVRVVAVHTDGQEREFLTPHRACTAHRTYPFAASYVARPEEREAMRLIVHLERGWEPEDVRLRVVIGGPR